MTTQTYRNRNGHPTRVMLTFGVMLQPLKAHDGTKVQRTMGITKHLHIIGEVVFGMIGGKRHGFGLYDSKTKKVEIRLPKVFHDSHEAYKAYKKPIDDAL